jgi:hypothetical protein
MEGGKKTLSPPIRPHVLKLKLAFVRQKSGDIHLCTLENFVLIKYVLISTSGHPNIHTLTKSCNDIDQR